MCSRSWLYMMLNASRGGGTGWRFAIAFTARVVSRSQSLARSIPAQMSHAAQSPTFSPCSSAW